jgi:hyperosmotically inducible periplasmic protein
MKRLLFGFILGVLVGVWGYSIVHKAPNRRAARSSSTSFAQDASRILRDIRVEDVRQELERTGLVIRQKAAQIGTIIIESTADARITGAIKARLLSEPGVSSMGIDVNTTGGIVTLAGSVSSHEEVARAMRIALETDGVVKVISTLQVRPRKTA